MLKGCWQVPFVFPQGYAFRVTERTGHIPMFNEHSLGKYGRVHRVSWWCCRIFRQLVSTSRAHPVPVQPLGWSSLTVNLVKCEFAKAKVTYLGRVVGKGEVCPVEGKIQAVAYYPLPPAYGLVNLSLHLSTSTCTLTHATIGRHTDSHTLHVSSPSLGFCLFF